MVSPQPPGPGLKAFLATPKQITSDRRVYTKDPAPIEKHRHRVAKAIEELTALD